MGEEIKFAWKKRRGGGGEVWQCHVPGLYLAVAASCTPAATFHSLCYPFWINGAFRGSERSTLERAKKDAERQAVRLVQDILDGALEMATLWGWED